MQFAGLLGLQTYPGLQPKVKSDFLSSGAKDPVGKGHNVTSKIGVTVTVSPGSETVVGGMFWVSVVIMSWPGTVAVIVCPSSVSVTVSSGPSIVIVVIRVIPGSVVMSPGRVMVSPGAVIVCPGAVIVSPGAVTVSVCVTSSVL